MTDVESRKKMVIMRGPFLRLALIVGFRDGEEGEMNQHPYFPRVIILVFAILSKSR